MTHHLRFWLSRRVAPVLGIMLALLVTAPAAYAFPGLPDCKANVEIDYPSDNAASFLDHGPKHPRKFSEGGTYYENLGYGGLHWFNYDPGCAASPLDPLYSLANSGLELLALGVGWLAFLTRVAFDPEVMKLYDPILRLTGEGFGVRLLLPFFGLVGCVAIVLMAFKAHNQRTAYIASNSGRIVGLAIVGLAVTLWPTVVGPYVDRGITGVVREANLALVDATQGNDGQPSQHDLSIADGVTSNIHYAVLYETWCAGIVGRPNSEAAAEFCPKIFKASTLTRAQVQLPEDERNAVKDRKHDRLKDLYSQLHDKYPGAYQYVAGHKNGQRALYVTLGWVAFYGSGHVGSLAAILMLLAETIVRVSIMMLPLVVLFAILFPGKVRSLLDMVATIVLTGVVAGVVSAAHTAVVGGFVSPETGSNSLLAMLLIGIATICADLFILWMAAAQFKARKDRRRRADQRRKEQRRPTNSDDDEDSPSSSEKVPAEVNLTRAAARGAGQGAAATAALGLATGGAVTAGALAAGAAKGAVMAGTSHAVTKGTGSQTAGSLASAAAAKGLSKGGRPPGQIGAAPRAQVATNPSQVTLERMRAGRAHAHPAGQLRAREVRALPAGASAQEPAQTATSTPRTTGPAPRVSEPRAHVYRPGESPRVQGPAAPQKPDGAYQIYRPSTSRGDQ